MGGVGGVEIDVWEKEEERTVSRFDGQGYLNISLRYQANSFTYSINFKIRVTFL